MLGFDNSVPAWSTWLLEDSERLKQAFNLALSGLHLVDRNDPICQIVARKIIEIGMNGASDPHEIAALTIKQLGPDEAM